MSIEQKLTEIEQIFGHTHVFPSLAYSSFTKSWYVTTTVEVLMREPNDFGDVTVGEHKPTQEEAVDAYLDALKRAEYFYAAMIGKYDRNRYPYRFFAWDGTKFAQIPNVDGYLTADDAVDVEGLEFSEMLRSMETWSGINTAVSGTTFKRCMVDAKLLSAYGVEIPLYAPKGKECYNIWCCAVGKVSESKAFFYGWTIAEALQKAVKAVREAHGQPKTQMEKLGEALTTI